MKGVRLRPPGQLSACSNKLQHEALHTLVQARQIQEKRDQDGDIIPDHKSEYMCTLELYGNWKWLSIKRFVQVCTLFIHSQGQGTATRPPDTEQAVLQDPVRPAPPLHVCAQTDQSVPAVHGPIDAEEAVHEVSSTQAFSTLSTIVDTFSTATMQAPAYSGQLHSLVYDSRHSWPFSILSRQQAGAYSGQLHIEI